MRRFNRNLSLGLVALIAHLSHATAAEVEAYSVLKGHYFTQDSAAAPVETAFLGYGFEASVLSDWAWATAAEVRIPSGFSLPLDDEDENGRLILWHPFSSLSELNSFYGSGTYTLTIDSEEDGDTAAQFSLESAAFPTEVPHIANFDDAQSINPESSFTLQWNSFGNLAGSDRYELLILDGSTVVFEATGAGSSAVIPSGTLDSEWEYEGRLRFVRATSTDENSYPGATGSAGFFNQTTFSLSTSEGQPGGGDDETPPFLFFTNPANGAAGVATGATVTFNFSEPMDPDFIAIEWSANLQADGFTYSWLPNGQALVATYAAGFPEDAQITWRLNPDTEEESNFRDLAGNILPPAVFQGSFSTGEGDPCLGGGETSDDGVLSIGKTLSFVQTTDANPVPDPEALPSFSAFFRPEVGTTASSVTLNLPGGENQDLTDVLGMFYTLSEDFDSAAQLEAAYEEGTYSLTANTSAGTKSLNLAVGSTADVSIPKISNLVDLKTMDPSSDFTLRFSAFPNPGEFDSIFISISGDDTNFFAPDLCHDRELPNTATSLVIPAGTLKAGGVYSGSITFSRLTDSDSSLENYFGSATVSAQTNFEFTLGAGPEPAAPVWSAPVLKPDGTVEFTVTGEAGRTFFIETANDLGEWVPHGTHVSISGVVTVTLDSEDASRQFLRARVE